MTFDISDAIPIPTSISVKSIIKYNLKDTYRRGITHFSLTDFDFPVEKYISTFKKLPWVQYQKISENHIFIWLNDPKSSYSNSISPLC